jgi:hypothetical protein
MALTRSTSASVLAASAITGPAASPDTDYCPAAIAYTVGPTLVPTLGATDLYCHEHLIEGCDIIMLQGEILALGFDVWCNTPGTYSVYLASTGRDVSYVANFQIYTASTWVRVKINNIPALPTGMGTWNFSEGQTGLYIGVVMATGSQWQATPSQLNSWQHAFFAGSAQNSNLCTVVNNKMYISGIKLEASPTCTYLSVPSFEADLHDLIRYYFTTFNYQILTAGVPITFVASGTNVAYGALTFPRKMCKAPNVVPYGWTSHAAGNVTDMNTGTDVAQATLPAFPKGVGGSITAASTKGDVMAALIIADARLS